jgi:glyoxylase-like metal-dependent hydrolase (beta-lactamase superfamily II)
MTYLKQLQLGPMDNFVYLVGDDGGDTCAVVDPAWDVDAIVAAAAADGRRLTHALVTHHHGDHTNGLIPLLERQAIRVVVQRAELDAAAHLARLSDAILPVTGGDVLELGKLKVTCIHTPGHTPGSQCFQFGDALATGDTLFIGACGRCDLPGGDVEAMFDSLSRLRALSPRTQILPGHDYGETPTDTLESQLLVNPYLHLARRDAFIALRTRPRG